MTIVGQLIISLLMAVLTVLFMIFGVWAGATITLTIFLFGCYNIVKLIKKG